jgi:hypothetical protein
MGEQFFNWQSDMDWAWGPLLPLRPPSYEPIRPWVWIRLFIALTVPGLLLLALLAFLGVTLPRWAVTYHHTLPAALSETLSTLHTMATDPATRLLLIGLLLSLPPLFFLFCLPYHWAWNCRAARLSQEPRATKTKSAPAGVWPPPPKESDPPA